MGLRLEWLGTKRLTWRDLLVIVRQSAPGSRIAAVLSPEAAWSVQEHLAAGILDTLRVLAWRQTRDGQQGRNAPTPTPRPGVKNPNVARIGNGSKSVVDMEAWLAKRNPAQHLRG